MKRSDLPRLLRQKRAEALAYPFPLTADLPDEFDDLYAEWVELNTLVMATVEKVLEGRHVGTSEIEPKNLAHIKRTLGKLEAEHPEIAAMYTEPFRVLEALLSLVKDRAPG